jgi:glyoxylase-like metal-dependent hydrolase (beta-lactamase superfamily II)
VAALKRATGATVLAHEWEADIVAGERRAQPVTLRPMQSLRLLPFQLGLALGRPKHVPCPVDDAVGNDDAVGPLQVLHAPGHSPGHLAFFWPERGVLLAGDAIATWPELCPGWKAFTLNEEQHADSLRRMAALDARVVCVGHGDAITQDAADLVRRLLS